MKRGRLEIVAAVIVLLAGGWMLEAQDVRDHHQMHQRHRNPETYIAALEDPKRDAYQKPQEVIAALDIEPGERIADIGSGSGYFTFRLARAVAMTGRIYAVDVSPDMVRHVNRLIRDHGVTHVVSILAPPDDPLVPEPVDRFFFSNVWHHIDDQAGYLAHMKRGLKPGGQVVMIDFHKRDLPVGPPMQMKIAREDLLAQMQQHGFRLLEEHTFLPYQYFLVFGVEAGDRDEISSIWQPAERR
jgi:ubiquinone/menaquinone biosynthesis C-methylase UbiE